MSEFILDNKISAILIAALLTTVLVMAVGFVYLQNEIDSLKPQATSAPNNSPNLHTPTITEPIQPTPNQPQATVTYTWYLKPELMNIEDWLKGIMNDEYTSSMSWHDNYATCLSSFKEIPQFVESADLTGLVGASFILQLPVTVNYDNSTGKTIATYENAAELIFGIESALPDMAVNGNWTRTVF